MLKNQKSWNMELENAFSERTSQKCMRYYLNLFSIHLNKLFQKTVVRCR